MHNAFSIIYDTRRLFYSFCVESKKTVFVFAVRTSDAYRYKGTFINNCLSPHQQDLGLGVSMTVFFLHETVTFVV